MAGRDGAGQGRTGQDGAGQGRTPGRGRARQDFQWSGKGAADPASRRAYTDGVTPNDSRKQYEKYETLRNPTAYATSLTFHSFRPSRAAAR